MVKVYTTNTCPWCVKAKTFLKSENIEFQELNVQDDMEAREEMIKKSNQMGVPVLDINDNIIIGFDKPAILKALGK
ncbi:MULTISPECIES: glutaredoxin family protein [Clostridium]|jgi:Glutaredoxin-like protein, YruB-family|uniref:Glutaredoxin family protein n=4 Tax=Clostridium TaxID=1485 RepID=A0A1B9BIX8_CLOBE|nr:MULTISPECIES: glutaredoxin family protein [Clostridium]ABR32315.1 glutaredoxin-like protein, YruB-family [Clostridium beijerinckii NCIMB 8052]AIU04314.1 YruB family glutaredoxin-like protein [Clostridium beijerinckii ATCC 35702]ALB48485.1 glutaredoxin family protein [Clostridium beijerinckii NRRL B-598]AVK49180.1 NrdH-redoxin [Clostridium sp. MF28]MBC2459498.1 glutaredoxin family protein [Clostridium beijerinckii]